MRCEICGTALADDLFSAVTGEKVCSICKIHYVGGLPTTPERIKAVREALLLADGQYLLQDNAKEARRILGRES